MADNKPDLQAAHPFHSAIPGEQGGSLPKVNNDHLAACMAKMESCRGSVQAKLGHLKPPRLVK